MSSPGWSIDVADVAFRYKLISPLLDPDLSKSEKKSYRRNLLARAHQHPTKGLITVSARSLRRWLRRYRIHGSTGLTRRSRRDRGSRILGAQHIQLAVDLLKENPRRDTPFLIDELEREFNELTGRVKRSTLNRHLHALGVRRRCLPEETAGGPPYRSFEPSEPNALWHSDCHHGPPAIGPDGKVAPTRIFAWIDDFSRVVCHCEAYLEESLPCLEDCLSKAMQKFGPRVPAAHADDGYNVAADKKGLAALLSLMDVLRMHTGPGRARVVVPLSPPSRRVLLVPNNMGGDARVRAFREWALILNPALTVPTFDFSEADDVCETNLNPAYVDEIATGLTYTGRQEEWDIGEEDTLFFWWTREDH